MSINIASNTNNPYVNYVNYVNYTKTPVAFRANNSAPQNKSMSTEKKLLIGGGVVAGAAALVIGAKKGLFGTNIKNKINELFKKIGGDAKAKAEQEAKLKAEQEAKAKAEKEAQERARNTSPQNNKPSNNTGSATTSSSSQSSGTSNSGGGGSARRSSGRRNSGGHSGTSRSTNNSAGSSNNVNPTGTAAKPNGNPTPTAQPKPQNNAAAPNVNPQPTLPPKAPVTSQPKPQTGAAKPNVNSQPTAQHNPQPAKPEPAAAQPKPQVTQPLKEILDKINEINAAYTDALKDQPISFIKTFENGEIITTASVKTEQFIETMLSEVPANVPETLKQELKTALEKESEKLKLVRTGKVDDEKMLEEFSGKFSDFFENIDNNPAFSSIKKKVEQWEKRMQEEANHILQGIERDAIEVKEAQRKIDIAQAVHTAQGGMRLSGKSAEESANVFSEAISKENLNAKRMIQNAYDETMSGRLGHITSKEDAKKYMMQKIEQYVQKCGTFKKVNKNVEINGERINIIYEGIDVDITSEGKLLKKVFVSKPQKAPEMQYENLSKRLADQVEADAEYARRQAQRQRQAQQQRRMLNA